VRAALFDFDGVLVDSEPVHFRAMRDSLLPEGIAIERDEYAGHYMGYDDREAIRRALERHGVVGGPERVHAVAVRKASGYGRLMAEIPFLPGAQPLVRALAARVPVGIASGARRTEIEGILTAAGLRDAFAAIVGAEDVRQGKPHPEPYLAAMALLASRAPDLRPEQCVVFEDSVAGVAAARAAGMKVVAVTTSNPAARLAAAHKVVASLEEIGDLASLFAA
jgi:beta-phosphoglucomutase